MTLHYVATTCVTLAVLGLLAALLDRTDAPTDKGGWDAQSPEFQAMLMRHEADQSGRKPRSR